MLLPSNFFWNKHYPQHGARVTIYWLMNVHYKFLLFTFILAVFFFFPFFSDCKPAFVCLLFFHQMIIRQALRVPALFLQTNYCAVPQFFCRIIFLPFNLTACLLVRSTKSVIGCKKKEKKKKIRKKKQEKKRKKKQFNHTIRRNNFPREIYYKILNEWVIKRDT